MGIISFVNERLEGTRSMCQFWNSLSPCKYVLLNSFVFASIKEWNIGRESDELSEWGGSLPLLLCTTTDVVQGVGGRNRVVLWKEMGGKKPWYYVEGISGSIMQAFCSCVYDVQKGDENNTIPLRCIPSSCIPCRCMQYWHSLLGKPIKRHTR